jgi:hypothetical protein
MNRPCRCSLCRNVFEEVQTGAVEFLHTYGEACENCGFYAFSRPDGSEGVCLKFSVREQGEGMALVRRRLGILPQGALPLITGGTYFCGDFRPLHDAPALEE